MNRKGFAFIDVLRPCVIWNKVNTYEWYKERVYKLDGEDHDPEDRAAAFQKALLCGGKIPIGLFFREERRTYEEDLPQLKKGPLVKQKAFDRDIGPLMDEFI